MLAFNSSIISGKCQKNDSYYMAYKLGYHFKTTTQILARLMSFNRLFEQNVIVNYPRRLHFCRLLGQTQFFCSVQQFLKLPFFICTMDLLRRVCLHFQYRCAFDSLSIEKSRFFWPNSGLSQSKSF